MTDSIGQEIASIQNLMRTDLDRYVSDEPLQERYRSLVEARDSGAVVAPTSKSTKEMSELRQMMADQHSDYWQGPNAEANQARYRALISGDDGESWRSTPAQARQSLPQQVVAAWSETGFEENLRRAQDAWRDLYYSTTHHKVPFFEGMDGLSQPAQSAIYIEMGRGDAGFASPASDDEINAFSTVAGADACIRAWGDNAARKVGICLDRYQRIVSGLTARDKSEFAYWFHRGLTAQERACAFWVLGGR